MSTESLVEGWTQPLLFQLKKQDFTDPTVFAPFDATGMTLSLVLKTKDGTAVDVVGDVAWDDEETSIVKYTPDAADLVAASSPYTAHWKITDSQGAIIYIPKGAADIWIVSKQ